MKFAFIDTIKRMCHMQNNIFASICIYMYLVLKLLFLGRCRGGRIQRIRQRLLDQLHRRLSAGK